MNTGWPSTDSTNNLPAKTDRREVSRVRIIKRKTPPMRKRREGRPDVRDRTGTRTTPHKHQEFCEFFENESVSLPQKSVFGHAGTALCPGSSPVKTRRRQRCRLLLSAQIFAGEFGTFCSGAREPSCARSGIRPCCCKSPQVCKCHFGRK
jgi:hypothetical protein